MSRNGGTANNQSTPKNITQGVVFELKKSASQLQVKIKRESINFIKKDGSSSRNSTVRESMQPMKSDSMSQREDTPFNIGVQSVMSSRQNPLTSKSIEDKSEMKQSQKNKHNNKLVQNFISLFRKNSLDRQGNELKKKMFI